MLQNLQGVNLQHGLRIIRYLEVELFQGNNFLYI